MLEYNEITLRKFIIFENEPYEVLASHVFRKQQRKPVNATKLRNLITGRIVEHSFHVSDKASEADISTKKVKYMYFNKGEYWFCDPTDPKNRFVVKDSLMDGNTKKFLKDNCTAIALMFEYDDEEQIIGVKLPIKVNFVVKEAPPSIKGDSATGGNKQVVLENGTSINVPLFINAGEIIVVNTESAEYVERAK
jgi:elongation factor P